MILVTGASSGAADASVSRKSGSSTTPGTTGLRVRPLLGPEDLEQCPNKSSRCPGVDSAFETSLPGTSMQLTKKARRSDPDAVEPLGASLQPPVDSAYAAVVARSPWERYSTTLVSFVPLSWHPRKGELDRAIRSFCEKYAHSIWNRSFMTSSGAAERVVEALMGSLLGSLFRVVLAYGVQLLRFLCYPHSYWRNSSERECPFEI
ncbi:hypothetical protein B5M09_013543 [Aphanomyces astaci]|uniref:Uncharacterized protein n=1 Tax=Aphanomyces astaci TaxID=112090 RepID=A0A425DKW6_APHAT|nr:hypothetical protein B5M09_013543 [Aphanomyces astaci]